MSVQDNKLIIKTEDLQGVDLSLGDFEMLCSIQPTWTKVTKEMWKEGRQTFIGVRGFVDAGDIIKVGSLHKLYRVMELIKVEGVRRGKGGKIFQIKRTDGNFTTQTDIDNIKKGQNVKVLGRKNFADTLDHKWGRDYVEPCPVEYKTTLPCDPVEDCECNCE